MTTYHDLHVTTATIPRTAVFNLPYGLVVECTRAGGWRVWDRWRGVERLIASEYGDNWLVLDVAGHEIVNTRGQQPGLGVAPDLTKDLGRCIFNNMGDCIAKIPEACECSKMPDMLYRGARAVLEAVGDVKA